MNRLRIWIVILVIWLPSMVFIEHALVPADYRHNILLFLLSTVAAILLTPKPLPNRALMFGLVVLFIAIGILQNGIQDELRNIPLTVTRIAAILLTALIAHQININLHQVEQAIVALAFTDFSPLPTAFSDAQATMYRELQRARHHGRPLSLVLFQVDEKSIEMAIPRVAEEVRQSMVKKFTLAKVARVLDDNLPRFHSFALRNNCFIATMPETTNEEAFQLVESVGAMTAKELGLTVYSGIASLSDEATTFETLVELAEQRMSEARSSQQVIDPRQLRFPVESTSVEQRVEL
jgi:GGDEF domain-containing protein